MDARKNTTAAPAGASRDLIEVADQLNHIRNLVEAGFMAAGDINDKVATNALQAVAVTALRSIAELEALVETIRQPEQAGV